MKDLIISAIVVFTPLLVTAALFWQTVRQELAKLKGGANDRQN